jgi:hypothetical protein
MGGFRGIRNRLRLRLILIRKLFWFLLSIRNLKIINDGLNLITCWTESAHV